MVRAPLLRSALLRQRGGIAARTVALVLTLAGPAAAAAEGPASPREAGTLAFVIENDTFGERAEDRDYTNGFQLGWLHGRNAAPGWARQIMSLGDDFFSGGSRPVDTRLAIDGGQQMFTPKDLSLETPDPRDRPYAGLLYAALGIVAKRSDTSLEQAQLVLGVLGPSSRAKEVQREFHALIGADDPKGWDAQIRDRAVVELRFQRTEVRRLRTVGSYSAQLAPHYGVALGNLVTAGSTGLGLRWGKRLPDDFGPPRIAPGLPGSGYFVPSAPAGWYLFGGLELRYLAYSAVLDESSALGAGVTRTPWVGDIQLGVVGYRGPVSVGYTQVWRSPEYREQREPFTGFGALSLNWRFH